MHFELRIYDLAQGRALDMADRMTNDLTRIFRRNDVPLAGAWLIEAGSALPGFAYLMAHDSSESAAKAWTGFYGDADWHETRERTNAGSELVERGQVINASPIEAISPHNAEQDHADPADELLLFDLLPTTTANAAQLFEASLAGPLRDAGGQVLGGMNVTSGLPLPTLAIWMRWQDANARREGSRILNTSSKLRDAGLVRGASSILMSPLDGLHAQPGLTRIIAPSNEKS